jgi:hypothetical protein
MSAIQRERDERLANGLSALIGPRLPDDRKFGVTLARQVRAAVLAEHREELEYEAKATMAELLDKARSEEAAEGLKAISDRLEARRRPEPERATRALQELRIVMGNGDLGEQRLRTLVEMLHEFAPENPTSMPKWVAMTQIENILKYIPKQGPGTEGRSKYLKDCAQAVANIHGVLSKYRGGSQSISVNEAGAPAMPHVASDQSNTTQAVGYSDPPSTMNSTTRSLTDELWGLACPDMGPDEWYEFICNWREHWQPAVKYSAQGRGKQVDTDLDEDED